VQLELIKGEPAAKAKGGKKFAFDLSRISAPTGLGQEFLWSARRTSRFLSASTLGET
jgi:hypothetical protein